MKEDTILLSRFVAHHDEDAFTELVQRYLALVHATALRRVGGDAHLAQDVTQMVFIALAHKASSLRSHVSLAGWLYVSTHRATAEVVRREQRRKQREASAHSMNLANTSEDPPVDPGSLRPLLDDALVELKPDDREAVVLRFFAHYSFAQIGAALRITEEAARKRVSRSLDQLQATLSRRGITSTVMALGSALTAAGITTAPAALVSEVAAAALAQSLALPAAAVTATLASSLLPAAAVAAVLTGLWTILPQQRSSAAMADKLARLERSSGIAVGVQSEIDGLNQALALARMPPTGSSQPSAAARVAIAAPPPRASISGAKEVVVDPEGHLDWQGKPVTLDEFLANLAAYQSTAPKNSSQLTIKAYGARFPQLSFVFDEAYKAGITGFAIESDSLPDPKFQMATIWF